MCVHVPQCIRGGQRTTSKSSFFPSAMRILGTQVASLGSKYRDPPSHVACLDVHFFKSVELFLLGKGPDGGEDEAGRCAGYILTAQ